jgi:midasin
MYQRRLTNRDLLKLCTRVSAGLPEGASFLTEQQRELVLRDTIDCLVALLPSPRNRLLVAARLSDALDVPRERVEQLLTMHKPALVCDGAGGIALGRVHLQALEADGRGAARLGTHSRQRCATFSATVTSMQLLEAIAAAVLHNEPVLLTGETGTGKTSAVQHLAVQLGRRMVVVNLNQQTDSGDLLGGFKPVEVKQLMQPLMDRLMDLLPRVTSEARNATFLSTCRDRFEAKNWRSLIKLLRQAVALVEGLQDGGETGPAAGVGKRKAKPADGARRKLSVQVRQQWRIFADQVGDNKGSALFYTCFAG